MFGSKDGHNTRNRRDADGWTRPTFRGVLIALAGFFWAVALTVSSGWFDGVSPAATSVPTPPPIVRLVQPRPPMPPPPPPVPVAPPVRPSAPPPPVWSPPPTPVREKPAQPVAPSPTRPAPERSRVPVSETQRYAASLVGDSQQFTCLAHIVERESGWNPHAGNTDGSYGVPQSRPGDKMSSEGADWRDNPRTQVRWMVKYIHSRYGTPCGAWSFWQNHGWY